MIHLIKLGLNLTLSFGEFTVTRKQIFIPIIVLAVGIGFFVLLSSMKKPPEEKAPVDNTPIVSVESIKVEPMTLKVTSYGVVRPKYETDLVAQVSGQIVELSDTFVRGGFVNEGELLARIDPSDYQAALIDAQANLASARASLETERAQGKVAEDEWKRITDAAPTELSLRKPQLAQELARVKAAEASVLRAKRNLERTYIKAPYNALIESRSVGLGSFVTTGLPLGKVLGTSVAEVRLPVADNQIQFLTDSGNNAEVILKGEFAGQMQEWRATVVRSEGVVDNMSRMNYFVAAVQDPYALTTDDNNNEAKALRFGAYVNADILGQELAHAAAVPRYLVNNNQVATLDANTKLRYQTVNIVRQDGKNVIISDGLTDGDQIITSALDYPVDGMQLALPGQISEDDDSNVEPESETQLASVED